MKVCTGCGIKKPRADFHKLKASKEGLQPRCKACVREYCKKRYKVNKDSILSHQKEYYETHKEDRANYGKNYRQTKAGKITQRKSIRKQRQKCPKKTAAYNVLNSAIRYGKMKRSVFCESCGLPAKTEGHHSDYDKQLEVDWLCRKCHINLRRSP